MTFKFLLIIFFITHLSLSGQDSNSRVVVSTDIGGDPDDRQSLVRLLLYSNVIDIEGLIAAGYQNNPLRGDTSKINEVIAGYASVRDNLLAHETGFPTSEYLYSITKEGQRFAGLPGMDGVGAGFSTEGSDLIIDVLLKNDIRPVWFLAWGGISTLAQAIWEINGSDTLSPAKKSEMLEKIRVYDIAGQDNAGAWIASEYSFIPYIRNRRIFRAFSVHSTGSWPESDLIDPPCNTEQYFDDWFDSNIRFNHGTYGNYYPTAMWIYEGDTPSFLFLIPNGLNDPGQWWQGSWGGRFSAEKSLNPSSTMGGIFTTSEEDYKPFYMYTDIADNWTYPGGTTYNDNIYVTLHRWRPAFDNDFAARMDWTLTNDFSLVNHPPVVVVNGDSTKSAVYLKTSPGASLSFDVSGTYSPNIEYALTYNWWIYQDPSTYNGSYGTLLSTLPNNGISFQVPPDAAIGDEFHIILSVVNNGRAYNTSGQGPIGSLPLTSYRRIVVEVSHPGAYLDLRLFLDGPFDEVEMTTHLNKNGLIPLAQPFNKYPWYYNGTETVPAIPNKEIVDWILVEMRDSNNAVTATENTMFDRQAAFLMKDGSVVSKDGSSILYFNKSFTQQLFVVVRHRNHLSIMSAYGLTKTDNIYSYDFSTSAFQVYGGSAGYNLIGQDLWGMVSGDANQDGLIDVNDKLIWSQFAGEFDYLSTDFNLDMNVNNQDKKDEWFDNLEKSSQVPE